MIYTMLPMGWAKFLTYSSHNLTNLRHKIRLANMFYLSPSVSHYMQIPTATNAQPPDLPSLQSLTATCSLAIQSRLCENGIRTPEAGHVSAPVCTYDTI